MDYSNDDVLVMTSTRDIEKLAECLLDLNLSVLTLQDMIKQIGRRQQDSVEQLELSLEAEVTSRLMPKKVLH
ncbi:hypothetical protein [Agaribacterium sp. ZY112]|uniref:hypothetical protein n=1 Tax=Agaribacterium sp. ZY112 TaxID=3233574 RepID=UPI0035247496